MQTASKGKRVCQVPVTVRALAREHEEDLSMGHHDIFLNCVNVATLAKAYLMYIMGDVVWGYAILRGSS